jgi:hypothetical protein
MHAIYVEASIDALTEQRRTLERNEAMREHDFTLVLARDPDEETADRLYGAFDDGTIITTAGIPQIHFHREASSLEEAIRSALNDVRSAGIDVERVEMLPDAIPI